MKHTPQGKLHRDIEKAQQQLPKMEQLYLIGESQFPEFGFDPLQLEMIKKRPIPIGTAFFTRNQLANFMVETAVECKWKGGSYPTLADRQTWEKGLTNIYGTVRTGQSYWAGFTFEGHNDLHMTHKYLGDLTAFEARSVQLILDGFFAGRIVKGWNNITLTKKELFGPDKDIPVLVLQATPIIDLSPYGPLKTILDQFREDDHKPHQYHVSTSESKLDLEFRSYVLCNGDNIIAEWK